VILLEMEGTCYEWLKHFHAILISLEPGVGFFHPNASICQACEWPLPYQNKQTKTTKRQ